MPAPDLVAAVRLLQEGRLVAFPTETVYGLGADAANPEALARLYAVKGRPTTHPVIVHLAEVAQLAEWCIDIPDAAWRLAEQGWPGPLTMILKRAPYVPDAVTGGQDTVGIRIPNHPLALELLRAFGGGIAAPSANRFGRLSPTRAEDVAAELGDDVDLILDGGPCQVGVESTIIDLSRVGGGDAPRILRPGMMDPVVIAEALGQPITGTLKSPDDPLDAPRVPGALTSHYAPRTPVHLVTAASLATPVDNVGVLALQPPPQGWRTEQWITLPVSPAGYAQGLYQALRKLDAGGFQAIWVERPPATGLWEAVTDRLNRASAVG